MIARELHDSIAQYFALLRITSGQLFAEEPKALDDVKSLRDEFTKLLDSASEEVRNLAAALPAILIME
jgi:signal transduction histidine kinase